MKYHNPHTDNLLDYPHIVLEGSAKNDLKLLDLCINEQDKPTKVGELFLTRLRQNASINLLNQHRFASKVKLDSPGMNKNVVVLIH